MFWVSERFYFLSIIPRATVLGTMSLKYVQLEGGGSWRFAEGYRAREVRALESAPLVWQAQKQLWDPRFPCTDEETEA